MKTFIIALAAVTVAGFVAFTQVPLAAQADAVARGKRNLEEMQASCMAERQALRINFSMNTDLVNMDSARLELERGRAMRREPLPGETAETAELFRKDRLCGIDVRRRQIERDGGSAPATGAAAQVAARAQQADRDFEEMKASCVVERERGQRNSSGNLDLLYMDGAAVAREREKVLRERAAAGGDAAFAGRTLAPVFIPELEELWRRERLCGIDVRERQLARAPVAVPAAARPASPGAAPVRSGNDTRDGRTTGAAAGAGVVSGRPTVDSGTRPGSSERRDLCTQYFQAVSRPASLEQEWIADCMAMGALAVRNIKVLPPEKTWYNGGSCFKVAARKTEPWGRSLKTHVEATNGCPAHQLFYVELKTANGIWSRPMWTWPGPLLEKHLWPVNNTLPKLGYVSMLERDTAMPIRKGEVWTTEVLQSATEAEDIAVKILACDYATPLGRPRTVFRNAAFTAADCFEIPAPEPSANAKEWQRLQKDPRPIGPKPRAKATPAAPAPKP